ncbi:MAG: 4Fe-4S dicluster domain-containing protein [Bacteroidaceae bacterium]|nr:4Fe-4S dicluster domain-containing protein [Bacteroidaceae bacterium]
MLKKIRIVLAALFLIGITLLFVGVGHSCWGWMAKLQFLPSLLALNFAVIIGIVLFTLLFGRIYCSVICPMGVFQDLVIWIRRKSEKLFKKKKSHKFKFVSEHKWVRYGVLVLSIVSIFVSGQMLIALIAPYSAYGRMVQSIVATASGSVTLPLLITGLLTLVIICAFAWMWGREYCNTICPVGTLLSLGSRFSMFRVQIDESKCINCGKCGRGCKAGCIDTKNHKIDYSRCVDCFDCIDTCQEGAIQFKTVCKSRSCAVKADESVDEGRRAFLVTGAVLAATAAAHAQDHMHGGFAEVIDKKSPERSERLVPFGAGSVKNFYDHCTACQLCVSACKNGVLRPSSDLEHFMQPVMSYEKGYCRPECTACSQVCPAGAIKPVTVEQKQTIRIGVAKVNLELCLPAQGKDSCGNCGYHCPSGAIRMVRQPGSRMQIPTVSEDRCIGCGACENLCPSRPISAITVNGLSIHHNA